MKIRILLLASLTTVFLSQNAIACGDSLYRVGRGIAYRTYSAPLPGNLLVFAGSIEAQQLANALAESGHDVHLVASAEDLEDELRNGGYDVVIAPFAERATVESITSHASFLPVAMSDDENRLAKQEYASVLRSDDDIKRFLKSIHKTLKSRA